MASKLTALLVEKFILPREPNYQQGVPDKDQTEETLIDAADWIADRTERSFNLIKRDSLERSKHTPPGEKFIWMPGVDFIRVKAIKVNSFDALVAAATMIS